MRVLIRDARLEDSQALADIGRETFFDTFGHLYPIEDADFFAQERFSLARTRQDIAEAGRFIKLAFEGEALIGFLDCGPVKLPVSLPVDSGLEVYRLYLRGPAHGRGIAQTLMDIAITWAREQGAQSLFLGVYSDNARAQAFYRKYGFEIIGAYQFKVGKTLDDERIMELKLS
jgi:diamine N-acetyltransferase